jgi:hypothetical protein
VRSRCVTTPFPGSGDKSAFDASHVYSKAKEAAAKRAIDLQTIGGDYSRSAEISLTNEDYLKKLIEIGSRHKQRVSESAKAMQFFIIRGGAEGVFPRELENERADRIEIPWRTTSRKQVKALFDVNDILTVFDPSGSLVSAAILARPLNIPATHWTEKTANKIYNSWHNKDVSIYRNTHWFKEQKNGRPPGQGVIYLGLAVDDGFRKTTAVDIHKTEDSNGCILIVDDETPADRSAKDTQGRTMPVFDKIQKKLVDVPLKQIDVFEPKLIVDTLKAVGMKPEDVRDGRNIHLGIMHTVEIK